jgi:hypothetical protein
VVEVLFSDEIHMPIFLLEDGTKRESYQTPTGNCRWLSWRAAKRTEEASGDGIYEMTPDGQWKPATPESYHPDISEKIWHWLGQHTWTYPEVKRGFCVLCGKPKP